MNTGCSEGTDKEGRAETCSLHLDMDSEKSSLTHSHKQVESLRIRDSGSKGSLVTGVRYKLPVAETSLLQLQEVTCLQILVLLGDFNQPGTC